jgi:putative tricarboxylic transport membrane protein
MTTQRIWIALPYAVLLALAAWFYKLAGTIEYQHQGNNLGPDFWPRAVLGLLMIICVVQCAKRLLIGRADDAGLLDADAEAGQGEEDGARSNALLGLGVVLTLAYGAAVTILGFLISTFLFMVLFMYAGRYRSHLAIWLSSAAGVLILTLIFQKAVYVSLPRGVPPFDRLADALLAMF